MGEQNQVDAHRIKSANQARSIFDHGFNKLSQQGKRFKRNQAMNRSINDEANYTIDQIDDNSRRLMSGLSVRDL